MSRLDEIDQRISQVAHQSILQSGDLILQDEMAGSLQQIAGRISSTSYFVGYSFRTQVFYLQKSAGNAYSTGAGRVYVETGLVDEVKRSEGVLAFAIGHEMAHNRLQHQARKYIRRIEYEAAYQRLKYKDERAALAYQVAWWITEKKIERDEEHAADQLGLMAAAEAGYHPDYGLLADRVLRLNNPDSSKFVTFLYSNHPRWVTREEHTEKNYKAALAIFESKWPRAESSPGGVPPMLAILSPVRVVKSHSGVTTSTEVNLRNLRDQAALLTAELSQEGQPQRVVFKRAYAANQTYPDAISFEIPKSQTPSLKKASLVLQVTAGTEILYGSGPINLGSSHKVKSSSRSAALSTSHAAESVLAKSSVKGTESIPQEIDPGTQTSTSTGVEAAATTQVPQPSETTQTLHLGAGEAPVNAAGSLATRAVAPQHMSENRDFSFRENADCELELESYPAGAAVDFDGMPVGVTPLRVRFASTGFGFNIHVTKEGYSPWFVQTFASQGKQKFEAHLYPKPSGSIQQSPAN